MKNKGFTLIELLAVIIILAVIALIATPIILNVVDNAKESARQSSISGYADATKLAIIEYQFGHDGQTPTVDQAFIDTIKPQGSIVTCENVMYSNDYGVVLNKCTVVPDTKEYCFASGKTYDDCTNQEFQDIYNKVNVGDKKPIVPVNNVSNDCAKNGNTCTLDQIKIGVSMDVEVVSGEIHKFYILSDDGTNVTLLMDRNLDINGDGIPNDKVSWVSREDYISSGGIEADYEDSGNNNKGSITLLNKLEEVTNKWTNIEKRVYNLTGTDSNTYNLCSEYNYCFDNQYTMNNRLARARLPRLQELAVIYEDNKAPNWTYDYLAATSNPILGIWGYWMSNVRFNNRGWYIHNSGTLNSAFVNNNSTYGIRPVIIINKSNIK